MKNHSPNASLSLKEAKCVAQGYLTGARICSFSAFVHKFGSIFFLSPPHILSRSWCHMLSHICISCCFLPGDCGSQLKSHSLSSVANGTGAPALNPESFRGSLRSHPPAILRSRLGLCCGAFLSFLPLSLSLFLMTLLRVRHCAIHWAYVETNRHGPCPCESSV